MQRLTEHEDSKSAQEGNLKVIYEDDFFWFPKKKAAKLA
jgi:hypothetical protein